MIPRLLWLFALICLFGCLDNPPGLSQEQKPPSQLEQAQDLINQGQLDKAISLLQQFSDQQPNHPGLAHLWGVLYYKKRNFSQAVGSLKQALAENPDDLEAQQLLGLSYYFTGRYNDAIPLLERSLAWYPSANVDAQYVLGLSYMYNRRFDEARAAFASMFGTAPDSAPSYLFAAQMFIRHDLNDVGETYAKRALQLNPNLPLAHYLLGELYLYQVKLLQAEAELQQERAINPSFSGVYYKLADVAVHEEKYEEAEKLLQRSLWLDPNSTGPYVLLGKVLSRKGEYELASRILERALSMDPSNQSSHYLLGQAYHKLGREVDAQREFKLSEELRQKDRNDAMP